MVRQFTLILACLTLYACGGSDGNSPLSSTGKYPVVVKMGAFTTAGYFQYLIPTAHAAVSDLQLCFKRLRFKKSITDIDDPLVDENVDLQLGNVTISSAGTDLSIVNIPADTYYRIEFDLEPTCAGKSVSLSNTFGTFTSTESMKIKFEGVFLVDGTETLQLGVQDILNAANAYKGTGTIRAALQAVSGNY
ncbi:MAG TPA: hypothetical protein VNJ01_08275 [Bacteriovoracaceae bacterium]|nr:hypothetical protein [Bacteriovoracaceae bacterium]